MDFNPCTIQRYIALLGLWENALYKMSVFEVNVKYKYKFQKLNPWPVLGGWVGWCELSHSVFVRSNLCGGMECVGPGRRCSRYSIFRYTLRCSPLWLPPGPTVPSQGPDLTPWLADPHDLAKFKDDAI